MKAIKIPQPFQLNIENIPTPTIKTPNDVLIKITSCGICGSDMGIWNGTNSLATYPRLNRNRFLRTYGKKRRSGFRRSGLELRSLLCLPDWTP